MHPTRDYVAGIIRNSLQELRNPNNEHARAQMAAFVDGAVAVAYFAGEICLSEHQAALLAVNGREIEPLERWW